MGSRPLSREILRQGTERIRALAVYAFTFFTATFFSSLLFAEDRARMFAWTPARARSW
jgi:hypothetical protein